MLDREIRIVTLPPMRVAAALGFGTEPESLAWQKIIAWAQPLGLLERPHRWFGFNNPSPAPGSPNYGYEQWITLDSEVPPAEGITIKQFPGGLYAVTRCTLPVIFETWQEFVVWRENSRYRSGQHQWLEEAFLPHEPSMDDMELDLYMPIAE